MPQEEAGLDIDYDAELAQIQGSVAGVAVLPPAEQEPPPGDPVDGEVVTDHRTVEFMGRRFRIADKIGLMPLLKFATYADVATDDPKALAAMYQMLRDCIYPGEPGCGECEDCEAGNDRACAEYVRGDWQAFEDHAIDTKAEADDLVTVISKVIELISGRPTKQPSPSSSGRRSISAGSTGRSSARRGKGSRR